jgi:hypothetical protein
VDINVEPNVETRALPVVYAASVWLWQSATGAPGQHSLSKPVSECATFVSHSWRDDWWIKATMLRNHLFLMEYDSAILVLGLIGCLQALPISFLLQGLLNTGLSFIPIYFVLFSMFFASVLAHLSGVLLPSTWGPWPRDLDHDNGIWLDKVCIDQTSKETKQAGIANLGTYLVRCKTMTVVLGDTYLTRLWTTFELATYCKVHQGQLQDRLFFLSLKWATTWNFMWLFCRVELDKDEIRQLSEYSCLDAQCQLPADRVVVLASIRQNWGTEENFDMFVRTELPAVLLKGKEDFMRRSVCIMYTVFELLF